MPMPSMGGFEPPHLAKRQSGLYVPAAAVERTLLADEWRKLKRLFRLAREQGMTAVCLCREWRGPIEGSTDDRLVQGADGKARGGRITLRCQCTTWVIR